jgi:two-component system chemotaxis sensor kinase CheA
MISTIGESPVIHLRGQVHPLLSSREVFDCPDEGDGEPFVVVIGFNQKLIGLRVTRVIGQQEIVIKPLDGVKREGPISGATVRNDGGVSLIIDVAELMRLSRHSHSNSAA